MLALGLILNVQQIIEPLRNKRLVILALTANFILVPIIAYFIISVMSLEAGLAIGLIIMSTAAGAPFLPKLAQIAKGNLAFSVGLMVLLMVISIFYIPIILPLLLEGVEVSSFDIAKPLVVMMLCPLLIGLFVKARYANIAQVIAPYMAKTSTISILVFLFAGNTLHFDIIVSVISTDALYVIPTFLIAAIIIGYVMGGKESKICSVLALGTAQRNLSAALVVATQNFSDKPQALGMILVTSLIGLVLLSVIAKVLASKKTTPVLTVS